jgi:Tfp pilus assembly protein PilN
VHPGRVAGGNFSEAPRKRLVAAVCLCYVLRMADNVQSAMLEILKRIQSDVSGLRSDVSVLKADVSDVKARLEKVEDLAIKQRRDSAAILVMMRGTVGVFEERMNALDIEMVASKEGH